MALNELQSYLLLILFYVRRSFGEYDISKQTTNWSSALKQCHIATPEIFNCHHKQYCLTKNDEPNDIILNGIHDGLWVGFYSIEMSLVHVDCVAIPSRNEFQEQNYKDDASECSRKCLTSKYIGISKKRYCICFGESYSEFTHASNCVTYCSHPKRLGCGGKDYLSVYQSENNINKNENESENERKGNDASTNDSRESSADESREGSADDSREGSADDSREGSADDSREGSADDILHGTADDILHGTADDGTQARDRKLHVDIFFKYMYNETEEGSNYERKYGYVQHDPKGYILKFTDDNMQKNALCEKGTEFQNKSNNREIKKKNNKQTTDTNDLNTSENNDASVPALVSVGVLVAIAVAVVSVTFVYRRYRLSHRFNKMPERNGRVTTPEYNYPNFTYEMSSNVTNQSEFNNVEYNYPDFSMLNESESTKNDDTKGLPNQDIGPVDAETHMYSTAGNENEYNTASKRPDVLPNETYDHADPMTKSRSNTPADTTYDVSMSTDTQLHKYGGLTDNVYNTENDTYNQLGGDKPEFQKSDNVYGSNQIEAYKCVPNIGDDKDRPYNSTSEKFENCGITDNPYSELEAH